jgi:hypothetical protein
VYLEPVDLLFLLLFVLPFLGFLMENSLAEEIVPVVAEKEAGNNKLNPKRPVNSSFFMVVFLILI